MHRCYVCLLLASAASDSPGLSPPGASALVTAVSKVRHSLDEVAFPFWPFGRVRAALTLSTLLVAPP